MIKFSVVADVRDAELMLDRIQRQQLPFATALALTRAAQGLQRDIVDEMLAKFDRPTPYTLKSTFIKPATKANLEAQVGIKDREFEGNRLSSAEMLIQQFYGGGRRQKLFEQWLARAGYIGRDEYVVPGAGARLDQYGNVSRGLIQQILSQLRAGPDASAYASGSRRSKRNVARTGGFFFSRGGHLARGVWQREGRHVRPILMVIGPPSYGVRVDLPRIIETRSRLHWRREFPTALRQALATAR